MPVILLALFSFPPMAAQFAATKIGVEAGLTAWDIAAFRYGAAAIGALLVLASPSRRAIMRAAPGRFIVVGLLGGAFYGAIFTAATTMMPASHSTLFAPSSSIVCTLLVAGIVLGVWPSPTRLIGVAVILLGLFVFASVGDVKVDAQALGGDALFGLIGLLWGCFSVFARKWNLDPLCCVAAMGLTGFLFVPLWLVVAPSNVTAANLPVALGEAIFQGWFLTFVAFLAYMTLVHRLGPPTAALGIALIPPMGVAIATLVLHETTYPGQWLGAAIVVVGLAIAGGVGAGPLGRVVGLRPVP
ncbi:MAG: DMT family transporter [Hyphomicrobiales bacterium]|nr:DMT family transporter [Hyphomicrobiales bacterium]MBV8764615.1 DMT family transporter [Hyphomicrobiales bacterium]MBV9739780.1 DMT family transporter [Hyphomicrobiales bacterium]